MAIAKIENEVVGQYLSGEASYVITSPTGTSEAFVLDNLHTITGVKSFVALDSGNNDTASDADLTWSGNTLTIADGSTYDHSAVVTGWITVFGNRKV